SLGLVTCWRDVASAGWSTADVYGMWPALYCGIGPRGHGWGHATSRQSRPAERRVEPHSRAGRLCYGAHMGSRLRSGAGGVARRVFAVGQAVFRSADGGATWQAAALPPSDAVRPPGSPDGAVLALSPDFAADGTLLLIDGGRLVRSRDAGQSWQALDPAPDQ